MGTLRGPKCVRTSLSMIFSMLEVSAISLQSFYGHWNEAGCFHSLKVEAQVEEVLESSTDWHKPSSHDG